MCERNTAMCLSPKESTTVPLQNTTYFLGYITSRFASSWLRYSITFSSVTRSTVFQFIFLMHYSTRLLIIWWMSSLLLNATIIIECTTSIIVECSTSLFRQHMFPIFFYCTFSWRFLMILNWYSAKKGGKEKERKEEKHMFSIVFTGCPHRAGLILSKKRKKEKECLTFPL